MIFHQDALEEILQKKVLNVNCFALSSERSCIDQSVLEIRMVSRRRTFSRLINVSLVRQHRKFLDAMKLAIDHIRNNSRRDINNPAAWFTARKYKILSNPISLVLETQMAAKMRNIGLTRRRNSWHTKLRVYSNTIPIDQLVANWT